ncbi:MAG: glycerophosphodiester phosphodiesterase family protein [Bacteroidales bacterium]|nr:glycerophosphodiester phosphodiesterase family protein [Bacteroidales bacterium]
MKRTAFLSVSAIVILSLCTVSCSQKKEPAYATKAEKVVAALHDPDSRYVVVVSHRGDWRNYPENSLPAIESVIRMGVDVMELDIKMTKDSVLVLSHDQTLNRCTSGSGLIRDYTYEELQKFNLKSGHGIERPGIKIPTLREALLLCKDRIVVNVDHGYDLYEEVLALTDELGMTYEVLMKGSVSYPQYKEKFSAFDHNMMFMPVLDVNSDTGKERFDGYLSSGETQMAYEICFSSLDDGVKDIARRIKESGSKIWVNTIWASLCGGYEDDKAFDSENPDSVYGPVLDLGTSIIQTDRPEFLIKYLESKGRR